MKRNQIIFFLALITLAYPSFGQNKEKFYVEVGPSIPIGKELAAVYDFGLNLGVGKSFFIKDKFFINPKVISAYYINNPGQGVRDNFFQYGCNVSVGFKSIYRTVDIRPQVGIGYLMGIDFLTTRRGDFFERGLLGEKKVTLNTNSVFYSASVEVKVSPKVRVGLDYHYQRPTISLKDEFKSSFPYYNSSASLYGTLVEFKDQKMNFDSISIQVYFSIQ